MIVSMKRCLAALGLAAVATTSMSAQQSQMGPKWQAWIGCWTASVPGASAFATPAGNGTFVCITPSAQGGDAVDVTTIGEGKVVSTQRIDASGAERPLEAKGCTGVQRAVWSADERRLYLKSSSTCEGLKSSTSGILSMTSTGEWLDVRGVTSYGDMNVRVARYRDAGIPSALPTELASALRDRGPASETARIAAGAPIGTTGVIEASRAADSTVVAAWLLEREQRFALDAKTLVQFADARVPGAVTDALVAVSNPGVFRLARVSDQNDVIRTDATDRRSGRRVTAMAYPYDPWSWGSLGLDYGYRYGYPIGYGYGSGVYGYGYNNGYYGGYAPPIIIVKGNSSGESRGQMVKGRGYTQTDGSSTGGTASERPSRASSPPPPPPSSSGASSSGSSSSGGSSSEGRTAKPRS
jgi:hypothetical protein